MVNENSRALHEDAAGHTRCRATARVAPTGTNEIAVEKPCGILTFRRVCVSSGNHPKSLFGGDDPRALKLNVQG